MTTANVDGRRVPGFPYKTQPLAHQRADFEATRDLVAWGFRHEQGTGKAKLGIDTAAHLFLRGEIDGLLVVAPNGVHRNWATDEIPAHMPVEARCRAEVYYASRGGTQAQRGAMANLLRHHGLAVLAMTYDGVMTEQGRELARAFLKQRRCLINLDEAHKIKTPSAQRTKALRAAGPLARYRRLMTGTLIANGAFDAYAPVLFLDPQFWERELQIRTYLAFQHEFGVFEKRNIGGGRKVDRVVDYKHLDVLERALKKISSRVLKSEVLDLPQKVYTRRYFEMAPEQARFYAQLRDEYIARHDSGEECTAALAMVRLLRLQQVTGGWAPSDDDRQLRQLGPENRRLRLLMEVVDDFPGQGIIWARAQEDVRIICEALGGRAARCDGTTSDRERAAALDAFHAGRVQFLASNPATTGISSGLTLNEAQVVVYYNVSYDYVARVQSEDRCHRIGQTRSVLYVDLVAEGTVDEKVIGALQKKDRVAAAVNGDELRAWL